MEPPQTESPPARNDRMDGFTYPFRVTFFTGFGLIGFYALTNLAVTVWSVREHTNSLETMGFAAKLIQVSLGMMMGFFTIFLGMLAAWMGIEGRYKMTGHAEGYGLTLASASPGILLIVCGTFLVSVCLLKPMTFTQERTLLDGEPTVTRSGQSDGAPNPPMIKK